MTDADGERAAAFDQLSRWSLGPIPGPFIIALSIGLILWIVLEFLPVGRYLYAVGANPAAATAHRHPPPPLRRRGNGRVGCADRRRGHPARLAPGRSRSGQHRAGVPAARPGRRVPRIDDHPPRTRQRARARSSASRSRRSGSRGSSSCCPATSIWSRCSTGSPSSPRSRSHRSPVGGASPAPTRRRPCRRHPRQLRTPPRPHEHDSDPEHHPHRWTRHGRRVGTEKKGSAMTITHRRRTAFAAFVALPTALDHRPLGLRERQRRRRSHRRAERRIDGQLRSVRLDHPRRRHRSVLQGPRRGQPHRDRGIHSAFGRPCRPAAGREDRLRRKRPHQRRHQRGRPGRPRGGGRDRLDRRRVRRQGDRSRPHRRA